MTVNTLNGKVVVDNLTSIPGNNENNIYNVTAHPNPFAYSTNIIFNLPQQEKLTMEIFDIYGQKVSDFSQTYDSGVHIINWEGMDNNGQSLSNGTYFLSIRNRYFNKILKLILLK